MTKYFISSLFIIIIVAFLFSCTSDNQTARLKITLTDSPGDYEKVNVDIQSVQVSQSEINNDADQDWITLSSNTVGVINLLDYTNGKELTLTDGDFPAGRVAQIRLVLGTNNSISLDGNSLALIAPSSMQSGLKLQVNTNLTEGIIYKFRLDFDVSKSIVKTGKDEYILKPVVRIISDAQSGAIKGIINPESENVAILITDGSDNVIASSFAPRGTADYLVSGIEPGAYDLIFDPGENSAYKADTLHDILVSLGMINKENTVNLSLK